jgi:esterase/lipase
MIIRFALLIIILSISACSSKGSHFPLGQESFEDYRREVTEWVDKNRNFVTENRTNELSYNIPHEWRPEGTPEKGILLIHGLGDSPWSFIDVGPVLAKNGFLVRTLLLPGNGTNPADMMDVTADDWRATESEQAAILQKDVPELYLGGFSAGAHLALEYAYDHPEVKGLLLFSPAIKSNIPIDFLAPLASVFVDWVNPPDVLFPQKDSHRYNVVPTNGFALFYYISSSVREKLENAPFSRPVVITLSEHDSVLDVSYMLQLFDKSFTHPNSRLLYYGKPTGGLSERVYFLSDRLPEWRVSSFSPLGSMFSPRNAEYGFNGSDPMCVNGQSLEGYRECLKGATVWYSAWGYRENGKIHARLTFNPYFDYQMGVIITALGTVDDFSVD